MIATVSGTVTRIGASFCVVDVSGIGYLVSITPEHAMSLRTGDETTIRTRLIVREDAFTLYGFRTESEAEAFDRLIGVSGIGPKSAMATLGQLGADGLARAVAESDERAFKSVPGIGPKSAKLIIVSLTGKLDSIAAPADEKPASPTGSADVVDALVGLGYKEDAAKAAVDAVLTERGGDSHPADVPEILRASLKRLGGSR